MTGDKTSDKNTLGAGFAYFRDHALHLEERVRIRQGGFWREKPPEQGIKWNECACGQDYCEPGEHWHTARGQCHTTEGCTR